MPNRRVFSDEDMQAMAELLQKWETGELKRDSAHHDCVAHSGMNARLNINILVNLLGTIGVALILILANNINTSVTKNTTVLVDVLRRMDKTEVKIGNLEIRMLEMERHSKDK